MLLTLIPDTRSLIQVIDKKIKINKKKKKAMNHTLDTTAKVANGLPLKNKAI